ncbi:MAG: hypothetical protein ACE5GB_15035, partial [Acidimicrobiales bacterium]
MDWLERQRRFIGVTTGLALMIGACSGGDTRQPLPTRSPTTQASSTQGSGTTVAAAAVPAPDATAAGLDDGRRPVILDYSPTVSDLGALAFLASHPGLRLVGVTLPGTGESHCGPGIAHTRGVLEDLG